MRSNEEIIGPAARCRQGYVANELVDLYGRFALMDVASFNEKTGSLPTYFRETGSSNIGRMAIPQALGTEVTSSGPLYGLGRRLQHPNTRRRLDHVPLHMKLRVVFAADTEVPGTSEGDFYGLERRIRWDYDKRMRCSITGEGRAAFIGEVESELEKLDIDGVRKMAISEHGTADHCWYVFSSTVKTVAAKHFERKFRASELYTKQFKELRTLLTERFNVRTALARIDEQMESLQRFGFFSRDIMREALREEESYLISQCSRLTARLKWMRDAHYGAHSTVFVR